MKTFMLRFAMASALSVCLKQVEAQVNYTACDLANDLYNATAGSIVTIPSGAVINLDDLVNCSGQANYTLPLVVKNGVTLQGDYHPITNPYGTLIYSNTYRGFFLNPDLKNMFLIVAGNNTPCNPNCSTIIRNIRLRGPSICWQEFNSGRINCNQSNLIDTSKTQNKYVGGIFIDGEPCSPSSCLKYHKLENCEISGFSYAGVMSYGNHLDNTTIENCIIHHTGGSSFVGIGYGVWNRIGTGDPFNDNTSYINNTIFDDSKDAIDGQTNEPDYAMNWDFNQLSLLPFAGCINRHNLSHQNYNYKKDIVIDPNCWSSRLYHRDPNSNQFICTNISQQDFNITDYSAGNIEVNNSVFWNGYINLPYPGYADANSQNTNFTCFVTDNVFTMQRHEKSTQCTASDIKKGYVRIADNYIENCVFDDERTGSTPYFFSLPNTSSLPPPNVHDFKNGNITGNPNCQPPYLNARLLNNITQLELLPVNHDRKELHLKPNEAIRFDPGSSAGINSNTFIVRYPKHDVLPQSGDYLDFSQQVVSSSQAAIPFSFTQPGLYGVDVAVFDNSSRIATGWQHIPIIVNDPSDPASYEKKLIFYIKDSYNQFHHDRVMELFNSQCNSILTWPANFGQNSTGIFKQVELNGTAIWREDIADGSDSWQRVEVNLNVNNSVCNCIPLNLLKINGENNTLSFSIAFDNAANNLIDTRLVNGLAVWVDDIYIAKTGHPQGDNLIPDGGLELSKIGLTNLGTTPNDNSLWYKPATLPVFQNCEEKVNGLQRIQSDPNEDDPIDFPWDDFPENNSNCNSPLVKGQVRLNTIERHSGSNAIQLQLPRFQYGLPSGCTNYDICNLSQGSHTPIISAKIDFDVTELLGCDDYIDANFPGQNLEEFKAAIQASCTGSPCTLSDKVMYLEEDFSLPYTFNNITVNELILTGCGVVFKNPVGQTTPIKITVNNNGTLKILRTGTNPNFKVNRLFACESMWQGIVVNDGGELEISGSLAFDDPRNRIEDAMIAVKASGTASVNLFGNDFDGNLSSVMLENGNFSNVVIQANRFTCNRGSLRRAPFNGNIPFYHVMLQNVCATCISYTDFPKIGRDVNLKGNLFENAFGGISLIDAKARVFNNTFHNIYNKNGAYHATHYGTGIFVANRQISSGKIFIGGENAYEPNTFTNVNIGAMVINHRKDFEITVAGNSFDNSAFGLQGQGSGSNFYNTALTFQYAFNTTKQPSEIYIFNNTILNHRIGIHAINYNKIKIGLNASGSFGAGFANTITFNLGSSPDPAVHYKGIWLQSCNNADILGNTVTNDAPTPEPLLQGIAVELSQNANIGCNTLTNLGRAIRFEGDCTGMPGTQLINNHMTDYEIGVELDLAQIPNQGAPGDPWDNTWETITNNPATHDKVSGQLLTPIKIDWYFQNNDFDPFNIYGPFPRGANLILPHDNQITNNPQCANSNLKGDFDRDARFGAVIGDSAEYVDFENELSYAAKTSVYETLKENDSLLTLGLSTDASFQQFYSDMSETNIGVLSEVATAIDSNQIDTAAVINETVNDTNSIEYARKSVNSVITEKVLQNIPLNATDSATLEYIFSQHWINAGEAVYAAAAILGKEYHSPYISLRKRHNTASEKPKTETSFGKMTIHPNPANDKLYLTGLPEESCEIEIYDCYCRLVFKKQSSANSLLIDLQNYSNGIYNLRVHNNSKNFKTNFVIIK